jgi:threonine/homoserine/homoserine lactone efflux protein
MVLAVGAILMIYFDYGAAQSARSTGGFGDANADHEDSRGFRRTFVLALTNAYQLLSWLTVEVALLAPGRMDLLAETSLAAAGDSVVETGSPALVVGLFGGIGLWIPGLPASLAAAGRRADRLAPVVAGGSVFVLAGFGVGFLADAVRLLCW